MRLWDPSPAFGASRWPAERIERDVMPAGLTLEE